MSPAILSRRRLLQGAAVAAIGVPTLSALLRTPTRQFRIGHQKGYLSLLKSRGTLEKRFAPLGVQLSWTEFPAGPVQLEALNAGAIDFGDVGEAPPIFAQAAGASLAYVAATMPRPHTEAVLVPKDSRITRVADLKGKKIALNKGSNVHYFVLKLFEKHGLAYSGLNLVFLPAADARAAFENGAVDAWVIWDPLLAAAQKALDARILADASDVVSNRAYYFSSLDYAASNADVLAITLEEINNIDQWATTNGGALAAELATLWGLSLPVAELAEARNSYGTGPITRAILAEQQQIADSFFALKLIPRKINVLDAVAGEVR